MSVSIATRRANPSLPIVACQLRSASAEERERVRKLRGSGKRLREASEGQLRCFVQARLWKVLISQASDKNIPARPDFYASFKRRCVVELIPLAMCSVIVIISPSASDTQNHEPSMSE